MKQEREKANLPLAAAAATFSLGVIAAFFLVTRHLVSDPAPTPQTVAQPAAAQPPAPIAITSDMLVAGALVLSRRENDVRHSFQHQDIARDVFKAMMEARQR